MRKPSPSTVAQFEGSSVFVMQLGTPRASAFDPSAGSQLCVSEVSARPVFVGKVVAQNDGDFAVAWNDAPNASASALGMTVGAGPVRRRKIVSVGIEKPIPECTRRLYGDSATVFGFSRETELFGVLAQNAELDQWFSIQQKAVKLGLNVSADVATDLALAKAIGQDLVQSATKLLTSHRDAEIAIRRIREASEKMDRLGGALRSICPDLFDRRSPLSQNLTDISTRPIGAVDSIDLRMPFDLNAIADRAAGRVCYATQERVVDGLWAAIAADFDVKAWPVSGGDAQ